jgi:cystathionine gamma-synthase
MPESNVRNLLTDPAWQAGDLGLPLPPTTHAVSVALPLWQDVIDYEEEHPRIAAALQAGYPRFFLHPLVSALFAEATSRFAGAGEGCLVFPSAVTAERAAQYVEEKTGAGAKVVPYGWGPLHALVFPESSRRMAREYWRYCGGVVSSRMAARALSGESTSAQAFAAAGLAAKQQIRSRLAALAGVAAEDVFLFPSGMAAMAMAHRLVTALRPGLATVQLDFPYVDVLRVQQAFGSSVEFFPVADAAALEKTGQLAGAGSIAAVFAEVPGNPLLTCVPLDDLSEKLRQSGVPLVLDDTVATVVNLDALALADLVTSSLTKAFSGAGDVIAGALTVNPRSPWFAFFKTGLEAEQAGHDLLWAEDAVVLEKNSRDFPERVQRMNANAAALTEFLAAHPAVDQVWYPDSTERFGRMARTGGGRGCLFSFTLPHEAAAAAFYDALHLSKGPSLGTNFSLCCPYTLLAHYTELEWAAACGVPRHLLRVSAGLEDAPDLIERFRKALAGLPE